MTVHLGEAEPVLDAATWQRLLDLVEGKADAPDDAVLDDDAVADIDAAAGDDVEVDPDDVGVHAEGIYAGEPDDGPEGKYDTSPPKYDTLGEWRTPLTACVETLQRLQERLRNGAVAAEKSSRSMLTVGTLDEPTASRLAADLATLRTSLIAEHKTLTRTRPSVAVTDSDTLTGSVTTKSTQSISSASARCADALTLASTATPSTTITLPGSTAAFSVKDAIAVSASLATTLSDFEHLLDTSRNEADERKYDTSPVGTPGGRQNWVDKAGGLPPFIRAVAHALIRAGRPKSTAIALAIGTIKRWARGGGDVSAKTRLKAQKTVLAWEKMRATSRAKSDEQPPHDASPAGAPESKESTVDVEYKESKVSVVNVEDEEAGILSVLVSVTGLQDRVRDVIEPGAYVKSLQSRTPKGVWSHSWEQPISKTLDVREVMPGDPMFKGLTLRDGSPWPAAAGALWVKTQFNLDGDRGRQAFSDVKFFGQDQEWSIGYNVPKGGAQFRNGVRHIKQLDLYEYSPVLFGAMPSARTLDVKSAQTAYRALTQIPAADLDEFAAMAYEVKAEPGPGEREGNEDGSAVDPKKPHKFTPGAGGKCKVCGLSIGGHMKAQKESASGEKSEVGAVETKCARCGSDDFDTYQTGAVECSTCGHEVKAADAEPADDGEGGVDVKALAATVVEMQQMLRNLVAPPAPPVTTKSEPKGEVVTSSRGVLLDSSDIAEAKALRALL